MASQRRQRATAESAAASTPDPPAQIAALARQIARRAPRDRVVPVGALIDGIARQSERTHRRLGAAIDAWNTHLPPELCAQTRLDTIRGRTLHVVASSSAVLWSVDRLLRNGLCDRLTDAIGPPVEQIRLRVGSVEQTRPAGPRDVDVQPHER